MTSTAGTTQPPPAPGDRRARRRRETMAEILAIAEDVMTEEGVNGLSLSEVARRLGVKPPSIYKYFDSLMAIFDALFEQGQRDHLEVVRTAMERAEPGLAALSAGLDASGRWALAHQAVAQMLFWRPVPSFEPTPAAMAPSNEMVRLQRQALATAVAAGELGPGADSDEALFLTSVLISGVVGQAMANEPGLPWGEGRFSPLLPKLLGTLVAHYPPQTHWSESGGGRSDPTPTPGAPGGDAGPGPGSRDRGDSHCHRAVVPDPSSAGGSGSQDPPSS